MSRDLTFAEGTYSKWTFGALIVVFAGLVSGSFWLADLRASASASTTVNEKQDVKIDDLQDSVSKIKTDIAVIAEFVRRKRKPKDEE